MPKAARKEPRYREIQIPPYRGTVNRHDMIRAVRTVLQLDTPQNGSKSSIRSVQSVRVPQRAV
jgi:hypothetical protein